MSAPMSQENALFGHRAHGVAVREDFTEFDDDEGDRVEKPASAVDDDAWRPAPAARRLHRRSRAGPARLAGGVRGDLVRYPASPPSPASGVNLRLNGLAFIVLHA
jgi:hypothetical protein